MKRIILTLAFLMAMAFCASAQTDLFFNWNDADNDLYRANDNLGFALPTAHGYEYDSEAPLGTGLLILTALGAGYAIKRRKE